MKVRVWYGDVSDYVYECSSWTIEGGWLILNDITTVGGEPTPSTVVMIPPGSVDMGDLPTPLNYAEVLRED